MTLRALVTNDDGIDCEGIRHLAMAGRDAGLEVVVAAPPHEASGSGAALSSVQSEGKILIDERRLDGLEGVPCYAVAASPAFIARLAIRGAFGDRPDVVLSGINRGANTGRAVVHSGTVGAAVSAYTSGLRGLAVSLRGDEPTHWRTAAALAGRLIPFFTTIAELCVLNLNVPDVEESEVLGLRQARLALFGTVQTTVVETGLGYVKVGLGETGHEPAPDSDVALLAAGYATLTSVVPMCERRLTSLPELDGVMQAAG
jgi:5'-nucleotidase